MMTYMKDPNARLDYRWDWSEWLDEGDTITAHTVTVTEGDVTFNSDSHDATSVTAWIAAGTVNTRAKVTARVTTAAGRIDDRTITIFVQER